MSKVMVVVADGTLARFFRVDELTDSLQEVEAIAHPEGRLHERDLTSDLPGKIPGGAGGGHGLEGERSPKKHALGEFAKTIAKHLDKLRNAGELSSILLAATPALLGEIRHHLSSETAKIIGFELDKNLTHQDLQDIHDHFPDNLMR